MSERSNSGMVRVLTLAVTFFTGMTGLVYEVTWHRYLANFLGSQAQAAAVILAVFLGGLSAGYHIFGKLSLRRSPQMLLVICGVSEVVIGLWAYGFHALYGTVWSISGVVDPKSYVAVFWEIAVSVTLIGVPTILMGGTLPLLTQGLSNDLRDASPFHARVYAINTGGAFLGCLLAGFYFLPEWGLAGTMRAMAPINLLAGGVLIAFALFLSNVPRDVGDAAVASGVAEEEGTVSFAAAKWAAFFAGFYSITLQTVFIRIAALSMGSSEYAFSMVVAVYVCMLAWGAWRLSGRGVALLSPWANQVFLFCTALALYLSISFWPYAAYILRTLITSVGPAFYFYYAVMFVVLALVLAIPVGAMGGTMPLLFANVRRTVGDIGSVVGRLYTWNTVGCVCGALVGGYWLLVFFDLDGIYKLCLITMALSGLLLFPWRTSPRTQQRLVSCALGAACLTPLMLEGWNKTYLGNGLFRTTYPMAGAYDGPTEFYAGLRGDVEQVAYKDSPNSTVSISEYAAPAAVKELNNGGEKVRNIKVNGKSDGETSHGDMRTMRLTAHLPGLLATLPIKRVAVVGFGLGVTVGSMSLYPEVERIHVIEISPAVKQFAHFFDFANHNVTTNPKVDWSIGDAYRVLGASKESYSLIISEPSNPWVTGVERLFAREFYEIVRSRLEPGGVYAQWIHDYTLSVDTLGLVFKTFGNAFPHVRTFRSSSDIIMLGSEQPIGDAALERLRQQYEKLPEVRRALAQVGIGSPSALLGLETWITKEQFPGAEEQTLEFPKLCHRAGRDFFYGRDADLSTALNEPFRRLWGRGYAEVSLAKSWFNQPTASDQELVDYMRSACDHDTLEFWDGWRREMKPCRDSLVGLALRGQVRPAFGIEEHELALLRSLKDDGTSLEPWHALSDRLTIEEARSTIEVFGSYDSIFWPLSVEKLMSVAVPCLKVNSAAALQCRSQLVEVLAVTGHAQEAKAVYKALDIPEGKELLGEERLSLLRAYVGAVVSMEQFINARTKSP